MNHELIIARVLNMFGVSRDELVIEIKAMPESLHGYWTEPGLTDMVDAFAMKALSMSKATIAINARLLDNTKQFIMTLAHELQHHLQWKAGRLITFTNLDLNRKRGMVWEGQVFARDTGHKLPHWEYLQLPWEVEARSVEQPTYDRYINEFVIEDYLKVG